MVCERCGEEVEHLWEGGYKVGPMPDRVPYFGHHLCPRDKAAIWAARESRDGFGDVDAECILHTVDGQQRVIKPVRAARA